MSIFNHGPYTDLHRLDLDWMINVLKKIDDENVRQVIIDKLTEWLNDGTLADIITDDVLEDISTELYLATQNVYYLLPGGTPADPCGESMILVIGQDAYIFDFGYKDPQTIIQAMMMHGVQNIKGIILSHYHDDHVGGYREDPDNDPVTIQGMKDIVNAFNTSGCRAWLPHHRINWNRMTGDFTDVRTAESMVTEFLTLKGIQITYPEEGDSTIIDPNTTFEFHNLDPDYFDGYYSYQLSSTGADTGSTMYNNFCMVTTIRHMNHKCVYTGDIMEPAEANVLSAVQSADIFIVEHHGVNRPVNEDYVANISPEIAVIPTGARYQDQKWFGKTDISKLLAGCEQVVITADAGLVEITDGPGGILCGTASGENLNFMYTMQSLTYGRMLLGSGIDLDDMTLPGEWSSQNAEQSAQITNAPFTGTGFKVQTIQLSPAGALLQIAYTSTTEGIAIAMRRRDTSATPTWHGWRYLYPSNYMSVRITDQDLTGCTVYNNSFNQCHAIMSNNVLDISLDIMTGANGVQDDTHIYTFPVDTYGRGAYFELFNPVDLTERYLARLSFESDARTYFVAPNVDLPANKHLVGHVTMVGYPFN